MLDNSGKLSILNLLETSLEIKNNFDSCSPDINKYGIATNQAHSIIKHFNLSGDLPDSISAYDFFKQFTNLNKSSVMYFLKNKLGSDVLHDIVKILRNKQSSSIIELLAHVSKLCNLDFLKDTEEIYSKEFLLTFARIFSLISPVHAYPKFNVKSLVLKSFTDLNKSDITSSDKVINISEEILINFVFTIVLTVESLLNSSLSEDIIYQDFITRINSMLVNGTIDIVSDALLDKLFQQVKSFKHLFLFDNKADNIPSYIFAKPYKRNVIDWSYRDFETFTSNSSISTFDAIYIFSSPTEIKPSYCIPYTYVLLEQDGTYGNIIHILSKSQPVFPIIRFGSSESDFIYTSSAWIEFDSSKIALEELDFIEKATLNI